MKATLFQEHPKKPIYHIGKLPLHGITTIELPDELYLRYLSSVKEFWDVQGVLDDMFRQLGVEVKHETP